MLTKSAAFAALASTVSAHASLSNPIPFLYEEGTTVVVPLKIDGSDFPCHIGGFGTYEIDETNVFEAGSTQSLEFKGTMVKGGGSCQISVTTDLEPTKDSVWKVIKSIEGGCPARNVAGNLPGLDFVTPVPDTFDFTVPDLAEGNYTLAWTWFNKVGNREMHMECAPMEVIGGDGSTDLESLPDMFVAHLDNSCSIPAGGDVVFPDAGEDVDRFNGATEAFVDPVGACSPTPAPIADPIVEQPAVPTEEAAAPSGPVIITTAITPVAPTQVPSSAIEIPIETPIENPIACNPGISTPLPDTTSVGTPILTPTPAPEPTPVPTPGPVDPPAGGVLHPAGTPCVPEGLFNCIDGKSFQRCASGVWSVTLATAPGTSCTIGESPSIEIIADPIPGVPIVASPKSRSKRTFRFKRS
ncbi:hypothetical protein B0I35DRAFT_470440 [Stachybotrys elegans]|uniref:Chitin-binding type-4 domain-containing protein n=1 Tax=Stachybotrys elegans TaxID=80388 RepID=A0A8K0WP36_9HYPO|nr:hypothetical protein B0I35DRAFT_470440 [Stachybotrys elegans]